VTNYSELK